MKDLTQGSITRPHPADGRRHAHRHDRPDALLPRRSLLRLRASARTRSPASARPATSLRRDRAHPDPRRGHGGAHLARRRVARISPTPTWSSTSRWCCRPSARRVVLVAGYLLTGPYLRSVGADEGMQRAGHHVSLLVPAGPRAAVRDGVHGFGAARHRHREADHDRAGAHGAAERGARADPDRGLGHRASRSAWPARASRAPSRSPSAWCCSCGTSCGWRSTCASTARSGSRSLAYWKRHPEHRPAGGRRVLR